MVVVIESLRWSFPNGSTFLSCSFAISEVFGRNGMIQRSIIRSGLIVLQTKIIRGPTIRLPVGCDSAQILNDHNHTQLLSSSNQKYARASYIRAGMRGGCWWELQLSGRVMARYARGPGFNFRRLHFSFLLFRHFRVIRRNGIQRSIIRPGVIGLQTTIIGGQTIRLPAVILLRFSMIIYNTILYEHEAMNGIMQNSYIVTYRML